MECETSKSRALYCRPVCSRVKALLPRLRTGKDPATMSKKEKKCEAQHTDN